MSKATVAKVLLPIAKWASHSGAVVVNESSKHLLVTVVLESAVKGDVHLEIHSSKTTSLEDGHLPANSQDFINKPGGKYPEIIIPTGQTQGSVYVEFQENLEIHPDLDYSLRLNNKSPELVRLGIGVDRVLIVTIHQDAVGEYERLSKTSSGNTPTPTPGLIVTATPNPVTLGQPSTVTVTGALPNENLTQSGTGATTYTTTVKTDASGKYTTVIDGTTPKGTYNITFTGQTSGKSSSISLVVG